MTNVIAWPYHVRQRCRHETEPDEYGREHSCCVLFTCAVCGGAEGSLPTHCPGERMHDVLHDEVMDRCVDYVAGRGWVQIPQWVPDPVHSYNSRCTVHPEDLI